MDKILSNSLLCGLRVAFIAQPKSTAVALGSDLVLNCSAAALDAGSRRLKWSASLTYRWTVDDYAVPTRARQFYNHSLYVPTVTVDDAGRYQCHVAVNASTTQSSRNATVVIACNNTDCLILPGTSPGVKMCCRQWVNL